MRNLRFGEKLLLLVPSLLLAFVALYFQLVYRKPAPDDNKIKLVITKNERIPVTSREAALGYDTKIVATFQARNVEQLPAGWRYLAGLLDLEEIVLASDTKKTWMATTNFYKPQVITQANCVVYVRYQPILNQDPYEQKATFLLNLSSISSNERTLKVTFKPRLRLLLIVPKGISLPAGAKFAGSHPNLGKAYLELPISTQEEEIAVREAVEETNAPQPVDQSPLELIQTEQRYNSWNNRFPSHIVVTVRQPEKFGGYSKTKWDVDDIHIEDNRGRKYYRVPGQKSGNEVYPTQGMMFVPQIKQKDIRANNHSFTITLPKLVLSRSRAPYKIKARVSRDDETPLQIFAELKLQ